MGGSIFDGFEASSPPPTAITAIKTNSSAKICHRRLRYHETGRLSTLVANGGKLSAFRLPALVLELEGQENEPERD